MRLVVLVPPGGDREGERAVGWARGAGYEVRVESTGTPPASPLAPDELPWCHAGDGVPTLTPEWRTMLGARVMGGGRLILTLLATPLAHALGAPGPLPVVQLPEEWRHAADPLWGDGFRDWPDYPHIRGMQGWGEHPLFDGLQRGTFTWEATEGERVARTCFRAPVWPAGRVLAVDRAYVQLDTTTAVAWEFELGMGEILCLGANVCLAARAKALDAQRDRLLVNALAYLDARRDRWGSVRRAWPHPAGATPAAGGGMAPRQAGAPEGAGAAAAWIGAPCALAPAGRLAPAPLQLEGAAAPDAPLTLASPHALVVGDEMSGVREAWVHPLCVLSDGVIATVDGAPLRATNVRVTPGLVERHLVDGHGAAWREVVAVPPDHAAIVLEIVPDGVGTHAPLQLEASLRLRLAWPLPGDALHPLVAGAVAPDAGPAGGVDAGRDGSVATRGGAGTGAGVVAVRGADGSTFARVAVDGADALVVEPSPTAPRMVVTSRRGGGLRLAVVASTEGAAATLQSRAVFEL